MKKNLKKLSAIALVSAMVMSSLAGCGGNSNTPTTSTAGTTASNETTTTTAAETTTTASTDSTTAANESTKAPDASGAGMAEWEPFADTVHITVPVYDRSKEGYPAVDDNYWTKWVQTEFGDKYNIEVKYVAIPRTDVMTKYSLLIAGGQTPTILMEYDYPKVTQWANDGAMQVIDLDEFAKVAPTYYNAMVEHDQLNYTDINGETYFVLSERPYYNTPYSYATFVRMDWLKQVGYDHVPKSYAEYTDALQKIMDAGLCEHPGSYTTLFSALQYDAYVRNFPYREYPIDETEWVQHSSLGTASLSWEPTYRMLKRGNAEYNAGFLDPEFDLLNLDTDVKADFINGKLFQYAGYMSANVDWLTAFYENNPDAELAIASNYSVVEEGVADYPTIRADNPFGMIVGFSSNATEEELKAAWMYMEWMSQDDVLFTLENGIEGVTYTMGEDGIPVVDGDYRGEEMLNHNCNIDMTCIVHATKVNDTIEQTIGVIAPQGLPQDFTQDLIDLYKEVEQIAADGHAYSDPIFATDIESEAEYTATLLSLFQEYYVALVKCAPDQFDSLYEEYKQKYLEAGYQEIIDERLAAYEAGNTTTLPDGAAK